MRYFIPYVLILLCSIFFQGAQISLNPKVSTPYQSYRIEEINPTHTLYKKLSVVLVSAISLYTIAEKNTKDRANKAKIVAETALKIAEEKQRNAETERDEVKNILKKAETERDAAREKTRAFEKDLNKMTQERDNINKTLQNTIADKNMTEIELVKTKEKLKTTEADRDTARTERKNAISARRTAEENLETTEKNRDTAIRERNSALLNLTVAEEKLRVMIQQLKDTIKHLNYWITQLDPMLNKNQIAHVQEIIDQLKKLVR